MSWISIGPFVLQIFTTTDMTMQEWGTLFGSLYQCISHLCLIGVQLFVNDGVLNRLKAALAARSSGWICGRIDGYINGYINGSTENTASGTKQLTLEWWPVSQSTLSGLPLDLTPHSKNATSFKSLSIQQTNTDCTSQLMLPNVLFVHGREAM